MSGYINEVGEREDLLSRMGIPLDIVEAFTHRMVVFPPALRNIPPKGITEFGIKTILRPMVGLIVGYTMRTPWTFLPRKQLDPVEFAQVRILIRIAIDYSVSRSFGDRYLWKN